MRIYSSGMQLRLAFAVLTSIEADMAVGDAEFSSDRLQELVDRVPVLVLASHPAELVAKTCNRVLQFEHGQIVEELELSAVRALAEKHA